jgi:hypothetical protein
MKDQKNDSFTKKLGDKVERAGEKISDKGAPGLGKNVKNLGDKIEHSQDNKKSR